MLAMINIYKIDIDVCKKNTKWDNVLIFFSPHHKLCARLTYEMSWTNLCTKKIPN